MGDAEDVRPEVVSERIATIIAARILDGSMPPGTRIRQDEIADELNASRLPVREALRILAARGLVILRSNVGAWVSQMTLDDLELSYKVRERIEPLLLTESLPQLAESDFDEMEALQLRIEGNNDVEEFLRLDREFHWTAYRHGAPQLVDLVNRLWDTTQHYRRAFVRLAPSQSSWLINAEHRLLLHALRAGDEESADAVLTTHIRRTRVALADHPELFVGVHHLD